LFLPLSHIWAQQVFLFFPLFFPVSLPHLGAACISFFHLFFYSASLYSSSSYYICVLILLKQQQQTYGISGLIPHFRCALCVLERALCEP
jgi:hypothetical protein